MSATIFQYEFKARWRSVLVWSLALAFLVFFFFSLFQAFADQAAITNQLMAKFPPALLEAFGLNRMDMSTVAGFYAFVSVFLQLCLAIQAGNYGFGLVSVEESELTADFLLSKPVSRVQVITSKFVAALCDLLVTDLVVAGVTFLSIAIYHGSHAYDAGIIALLLLGLLILQLFFLCVGLVISLLVKRVRSVTPFSLGLGFGMYVLSAFSGVFGDVKLEYITPFKHLDPAYTIQHAGFDPALLILNLGITILSLGLSYILYVRRDIPAVS